MTSSSFFEVELRSPSGALYRRGFDALELPAIESSELTISADEKFAVIIRQTAASGALRLSLGTAPLAKISVGETLFRSDLHAWFWNEFGDSSVRVERQLGTRRCELIFELPLRVVARPPVLRDYQVMMKDLQGIHEHLAHDVIGRSYHRHGLAAESVLPLRPDSLLQTIEKIRDRLAGSLASIAEQPSRGLVRKPVLVNYRGGERIDASSVESIARDQLTAIDARGRVRSLGKVRVRRPTITQDLPEHRQIAQAIRDLASRALQIGDHCRRSVELLEEEQHRWGRPRDDESVSVYEQRDLPRIERLVALAQQAPNLAGSLREMIGRYEFLVEAGPPRAAFGPTPTFLGRPAYRAIYDTLLDAKRPLGILVDGDALRIAYRDLATLYEYWCLMKIVARLADRLGAPRTHDAFTVIDDVYRPELSPGQQFQFEVDVDTRLLVRYTPEFAPLRLARRLGLPFGAALTREPLRPDVTIEVWRAGRRPVIMVLDAKSTERFRPRNFREISDYSRQIMDPKTGYQPVRQVFLMHRGDQAPIVNVPGYLAGKPVDRYSMVIGAIACQPRDTVDTPPDLACAIDRFLEINGVPTRGSRT